VIVHLGDPYTAQLNRYYTVEFYKEVKRTLKEGGIISFALSSSESYMSRQLKDFLRSIFASLKEVFLDVKVIPGDTAYFLACDKKGVLTYDYSVLTNRAKDRNIDIKYVRDYYLFSRLSPQKIRFTEDSLRSESQVKINYDFRPISYYYNMIFWTAHFKDTFFRKILESVTANKIWNTLFVLCAFILLFGVIRIKRHEELLRPASLIAMMATGFTQMSLQVIILLSFQIIYGYVFYKLGLIITCFMVGLALGGLWIIRIIPKLKKELSFFSRMQSAICIYCLTLPIILRWLSRSNEGLTSWIGANVIFSFLPITAGFIAGVQFPLVNKIYLKEKEEAGRIAGLTYGMDLLGSCLGALLAAIFFIPILGMLKTCWLITGVNLAVLALLTISSRYQA
jgi:spermidine synthase